jgi:hypothetical protein
MKIIKISKAGEMCSQPVGKNPSGKLDTQIFLEKEDPSVKARKKRKKKVKKECSSCTINYQNYEEYEELSRKR